MTTIIIVQVLAISILMFAAFALAYNVALSRTLLAYSREHEREVRDRYRDATFAAVKLYIEATPPNLVNLGDIMRIVKYGAPERDRVPDGTSANIPSTTSTASK